MKIVDVIWQKPVSTYAISACEALVDSVNSVNNALYKCTILTYLPYLHGIHYRH